MRNLRTTSEHMTAQRLARLMHDARALRARELARMLRELRDRWHVRFRRSLAPGTRVCPREHVC